MRSELQAAASQDWAPFVLVAGLLLIGSVANDDGLFMYMGNLLSRTTRRTGVLFLGSSLLVAVVAALLNLDTSVAFLTPVFAHMARSRDEDEGPALYGCLLLSNAGSLLLPGSNLTNLIVLGHLHFNGAEFLSRMWLPWLGSVFITTAVIGIFYRKSLRATIETTAVTSRPVVGLGAAGVTAAVVLVLALHSPAMPVFLVGITMATIRVAQRVDRLARYLDGLGLPILLGLFVVAVALGTLGRGWSGPADLLSHVDRWGTTAIGTGASVLVNNLPAASLLAARVPPHPFALLVGLDIGPNLCASGSLAWILWWRSAKRMGAEPSIARAIKIGLVSAPIAIATSVGLLAATGLH